MFGSVAVHEEPKYRLVCLHRGVYISLSEIKHVSRFKNGIYQVFFKDTSRTVLKIREHSLKNLRLKKPDILMV